MEVYGYLAATLIGVALGLIGGGGSILTVPVLVFLFGQTASQATAYSLFVVGVTALVGTVLSARRGMVDFRIALVFGPPSVLAVYAVRGFVMPGIPSTLFQTGGFTLTKDTAVMMLFAVLMLATAISMLRGGSQAEPEPADKLPYLKIALEGLVVGSVTGLVGAGGGFLIIPALVLLAGLPMKQAVGTSLAIISAKSLIGFLGDVQSTPNLNWPLILSVSLAAVIGMGLGTLLQSRIEGAKLKPAFGIFILVMGALVLASPFLPAAGAKSSPVNPPAVDRTLPH